MAAREGAPQQLKDVLIGCSWIPATPAKPNSTTQQPICENCQVDDPSRANWVEPGRNTSSIPVVTQAPGDYVQTAPACSNIWQTSQPVNSSTYGDVNNMSFHTLLALDNAGSNQSTMENELTGDLNSIPRTTTRSIPFQFDPLTPHKTGNISEQNKIASDGVMELRQRKEKKTHQIIDQSSTATSSQLQEADISKTPRLKARRKKHRPKVVIEEGQKKKRGPKPRVNVGRKGVTNPSEGEINKVPISPDTPKVLKTYSRRKSVNKPKGDVAKANDDVNAPPQRTRRPRKKSLNFDSGVTHDKEMPESPGESVRGLKRQNTTLESEICNGDNAGTYYSFMQSYLPLFSQNADKSNSAPGFHFPVIYKKRRTEKGQKMVAPTSESKQGQCLQTSNPVIDGIRNDGQMIFEDLLALVPTERIRKKRSKCPTRVRDLASLLEICRQMPAATSRAATTTRVKQSVAFLHEPPTCMEALVAETRTTMLRKKRSKRSMQNNSTVQNWNKRKESAVLPMGTSKPH